MAQSFDNMAEQLAKRETERDLQEKTLQEYAQNLEHSNNELKEFAFIASHDLQEPLRKIRIFGEMLEERSTGSMDARGMDYIQRMRDAAERMQKLLVSMLDFSRITNQKSPFVTVDLNQVLDQVLVDLDWQIEQNKAAIAVSDLPVITADPVLMYQLFANLVKNAIKFHKKDCPPVVRIFSPMPDSVSNNGHMCSIWIEDEGIGFDEKYLDRIVQPFQRLHARDEYEGTGMGLAICRRIVNQHGGTIMAQSQPGIGSTFIVHLPYNQSNERQG
jgi:light-regulated signal transduction histidine kinase (bacteriophytochrome)